MFSKTLLVLFLAIPFFISAQQAPDFTKTDALARSVEYKQGQSVEALATALSAGAANEKEKVRAFFVWLCDNIKYDVKTFENRQDIDAAKAHAMQEPLKVLKSKKGVCQGYSNLFVALCEAAGLEATIVGGITKNRRGTVTRMGHAWCLVRADGVWGLVDPTWGAGDVDMDEGKYTARFKEQFFFTAPELLITDHFPKDPLFQLLPNPLTLEEFKQPATAQKATIERKKAEAPRTGYAAITDSLNTFIALDSVAGMYSIGRRVLDMNPTSNYGLFQLGMYHYSRGYQLIDAFQSSMKANQGREATRKWCDDQISLLTRAKKPLGESYAVFSRSVSTDEYSARIRGFRNSVQQAIKSVDQNLDYVKKVRERAK